MAYERGEASDDVSEFWVAVWVVRRAHSQGSSISLTNRFVAHNSTPKIRSCVHHHVVGTTLKLFHTPTLGFSWCCCCWRRSWRKWTYKQYNITYAALVKVFLSHADMVQLHHDSRLLSTDAAVADDDALQLCGNARSRASVEVVSGELMCWGPHFLVRLFGWVFRTTILITDFWITYRQNILKFLKLFDRLRTTMQQYNREDSVFKWRTKYSNFPFLNA